MPSMEMTVVDRATGHGCKMILRMRFNIALGTAKEFQRTILHKNTRQPP